MSRSGSSKTDLLFRVKQKNGHRLRVEVQASKVTGASGSSSATGNELTVSTGINRVTVHELLLAHNRNVVVELLP